MFRQSHRLNAYERYGKDVTIRLGAGTSLPLSELMPQHWSILLMLFTPQSQGAHGFKKSELGVLVPPTPLVACLLQYHSRQTGERTTGNVLMHARSGDMDGESGRLHKSKVIARYHDEDDAEPGRIGPMIYSPPVAGPSVTNLTKGKGVTSDVIAADFAGCHVSDQNESRAMVGSLDGTSVARHLCESADGFGGSRRCYQADS
nr:hypothetical protein CFP56_19360 [Quercus suber]